MLELIKESMKPKIISLGYALPKRHYTQIEIFKELGYDQRFWRVFKDSNIDKRHYILPIEEIRRLSFQEQQETYNKEAPVLSTEAVLDCLDGRDPRNMGLVVYGSCTGFSPGPTIAHHLADIFGFAPSTYYTNIIGHGCESAYPGLRRAYDFVFTTGKPALVVNCELSSMTYYPEPDGKPDPENHFETLRANALFGDAASAALVGYDEDWRHPEIIDMETHTNTEYLRDLGYTWRSGRLRVLLSKRVPELAAIVVRPAVDAVMERQDLTVDKVRWWVIHAAGSSVLDNIRDTLRLPEDKVSLSRETLREFGNTSSTSVGITGKRLMSQDIHPGDYVAILSVGPGMSGGMTLCRFGDV